MVPRVLLSIVSALPQIILTVELLSSMALQVSLLHPPLLNLFRTSSRHIFTRHVTYVQIQMSITESANVKMATDALN